MLGDRIEDFSIDVPELARMVGRLQPEARSQMAAMIQGYLQMAHYAFGNGQPDGPTPNFPEPYLQNLIESEVTSDPYPY